MKKERAEPEVIWNEYPLIEQGSYPAYCKTAKWYWEPGYKRWTCLLLFDVLAANLVDTLGRIPLWFNGGAGVKPKTSLRSLYLPAWVMANAGPPVRNDRLSPKVFVARMARVIVGTSKSIIPYSVVRRIVKWESGSGS